LGALIVFEFDGRIDRNTGCGTAAGTVFRDSRDTAAGTGILPGGITGTAGTASICRAAGDGFAVLALGFTATSGTAGTGSIRRAAGDSFAVLALGFTAQE